MLENIYELQKASEIMLK